MRKMAKNEKFVVGVDLGGTNIAAGLVSESGEIGFRDKKKTKANGDPDKLVKRISNVIESVIDNSEDLKVNIIGIGMGVPGPLDVKKGIIHSAPNLGVENLPIAKLVSEQVGLPTVVDNDVNVGTYGEFVFGAGKGYKDIVGIFLGTGVGGGIILDGKLWYGKNMGAGEVGHMIIDPDGPKCGCGNKGCLEAYVSRQYIAKQIIAEIESGRKSVITDLVDGDLVFTNLRSKILAQAFKAEDKITLEVFDKAAYYLGLAIVNLIHFLNPELFIIGGGLIEAVGDDFLKPVRKVLKKCTMPGTGDGIKVVPSQLGDDAGILGAAALGFEKLGK